MEDSADQSRSLEPATTAVVSGCFLSGVMMSLSLIAAPVLLETNQESTNIVSQWHSLYQHGHYVAPAMSIATCTLYTWIALQRRSSSRSSWRAYATAGLLTLAMVPLTLTVMAPTNNALFELEAGNFDMMPDLNHVQGLVIKPEIFDHKSVSVFEGSVLDVDLVAACLNGCKAVFMVVTSNDNIPGCHLGQDQARIVIAALENLKTSSTPGSLRTPKLILLSSATIDDHLARDMPWWFRPIMLTAASHVYQDLRVTETLLRSQQDWVSTIFIKPGGLSVDIQRGHKLSLDHEESFISYLDLAGAMIEAADYKEHIYDMKNVSVINANGGARFPPGTPTCILMGLLRHFFPFLHPYLPSTGPS